MQTEKERIDMIFGALGIIEKDDKKVSMGDVTISKNESKNDDSDPNSMSRAGAN